MADCMIFDLVRTMLLAGQTPGVLADYLEEQGHPLAEDARKHVGKLTIINRLIGHGLAVRDVLDLPLPNRQKLGLVLSPRVLPDSVLGLLACDFAEHIVPHYRLTNIHLDDHWLRKALNTHRQWWLGKVDSETHDEVWRMSLVTIQDRINKLAQEIKKGPDHNLAIMVMQTIDNALSEQETAYKTAQLATEAVAGVFGESARRSLRNSLSAKEERWQVRRTREIVLTLPLDV